MKEFKGKGIRVTSIIKGFDLTPEQVDLLTRSRLKDPLDFFKSESWLANVGHVLAGYGVILTARFWWSSLNALGAAWCGLLAYVLIKEYVLDLQFESGETVGSSTVDALGYVVGAVVATIEALLR